MKKILSVVLSFVVLLGVVCAIPTSIPTANAATTTTFDEMLLRAEALVNYEWTPTQRIYTWNGNTYKGRTYFEAGERVKGLPYTLFTSEVVSRSQCSLSDYKNVVNSNYSTTKYCVSTSSNRTGPVYGNCCATFVAEVFGGSFVNSSGHPKTYNVRGVQSFGITTENVAASEIVPGDALSNTSKGHIIWVGAVTDSTITIYESTPPICQKVVINKPSSGYLKYNGGTYSTVTKNPDYTGGTVLPSPFTKDTSYPTPVTAYPAITSGKLTVYDNNLNAYPINTRNIAYNDECQIKEFYTNGYCKVNYPTLSGRAEALAKTADFITNAVTPYSWSPASNINSYTRSDLSQNFGTVYTTDSCKVVGKSGVKLQLIYPLDVGGYKLGWVDSTDAPVTPEDERPATPDLPGPEVLKFLEGKTIVAVAPKKITFSSTAYISEGDICKIYNVNTSTGMCTVDYPSGSNDIFAVSQDKVRTQVVSVSEFIDYNPNAPLETANIPEKLTVYPTKSMNQTVGGYTTNWYLDPGDQYSTINTSEGKTEVLYYCSTGKHQGCWKLGWVWLDYYYLDLNGYIDNVAQGGLMNYGTADVYVNGIQRANDVTDFYSANGTYPRGSTYEIKDIRPYTGYTYNGVYSGSLTGTLDSNKSVSLNFTKNPVTCAGITVTSNPFKTTYLEGESLNTSGLKVTANFSDGTNKDVTSSCVISGYDSAPGTKTITVSYSGKTSAFTVVVNSKSVVSISIVQQPVKSTYYIGETFDMTGLVVEATYDNNTTEIINNYYSDFGEDDLTTLGTKNIGLYYTYNDKTVSTVLTIKVIPVTALSLEVATNPIKTSYYVGDVLDTTGLSLAVIYNDGTTETISSGFSCSPMVLNDTGTRTITVSYGGLTTSFNVTVVPKPISDPDAQFVVSNVTAAAGQTVDVTVSVKNNPGIIAAKLNLSYDKTKLKLTKVTNGSVMGESLFDPGNDLTAVPYFVCWNDMNADYVDDGVMVTFTFEVLADAAIGTTSVTLTYDEGSTFNSNLENVAFTPVNGSVDITDRTPGDANDDGAVDLKDVVIIRRFLSGGWNVTVNSSNADVNRDDAVDLKDVVILRKYLSGWDGIVLK